MFRFLALLITLTSVPAQANELAAPERFTIITASGIREFFLHKPVSQKPQGLIVMLHGCKTTAAEFDASTGMSEFATAKGYAVLYPEQSQLANFDRCWNWFWGSETPIIAEGIREVQMRFDLDRNTTYLMGMSAGAAQGAILANCNRNLISAVLLHSGLQYLAATNPFDANTALEQGSFTSSIQAARAGQRCNKSLAPIRFMVVQGSNDQRVNPINAVQSTEEFLQLNQLLAVGAKQPGQIIPQTLDVPTEGAHLGYRQTNYTMDGKPLGASILVNGLAHEWSGGKSGQPRANANGPSVVEIFLDKITQP